MKAEKLPLFSSSSQYLSFITLLFILFFFTISFEYVKYKDFKSEELIETSGKIVNIYHKNDYDVLKVRTNDYTFFTSVILNHGFKKQDFIDLTILTKRVDFIDYLKNFYTQSLNIYPKNRVDFAKQLSQKINEQHIHSNVSELFNALFLAHPLGEDSRDFFASLGLSHLIAISGFHLGVLSFVLYGVFNLLYAPIHQRYFPYRNKKHDIIVVTSVILFSYLLLTGIVPSLLRAFIMFVLGVILLRNNIKLFSFETLLFTFLIIIALFPKYLFSLSLWFSLTGVFYIFLFIKYFEKLPKILSIFIFNFWIFFCFNPIVHFFFSQTTYEQLLSPILTLLFTLFYPIELFAHIIGYGSFLDDVLLVLLSSSLTVFEVLTPWWFFLVYIIISFFSIISKYAFILLNILFVGFNLYLFL